MNETTQGSQPEVGDLDPNTLYSELLSELRRYRDYELNVANWATTILAVILAGLLALWSSERWPRLLELPGRTGFMLTVVVVVLVGGSALYSVWYAHRRHDQLQQMLRNHRQLGPEYRRWDPGEIRVRWRVPPPRKLVYLCLSVITLGVIILALGGSEPSVYSIAHSLRFATSEHGGRHPAL